MALSRRSGRMHASIWPGFVDALSGLLLILFFVLSIFMVVQSVLSATITGQETRLDELGTQVDALAEALGLERQKAAGLEGEVSRLGTDLAALQTTAEERQARIATLTATADRQAADLAAAGARITGFEAQVAGLLADRAAAEQRIAGLSADLEAAQDQVAGLSEAARAAAEREAALISTEEALNLALARARSEIDAGTEAARRAAAEREALEALIAQTKADLAAQEATSQDLRARLDDTAERLTEEEAARVAEAAAAEALRQRLAGADTELTAMTLALEDQRKRAEDTLTLLAAAEAARADLDDKLAAALTQGQSLADIVAERDLALEEAEANRAALNRALDLARQEGADLEAELDAARRDLADAERVSGNVREDLAAALAARAAAEQDRAAALSEAERQAALVQAARDALAGAESARDDSAAAAEARAREVALMNAQVAELRAQLGSLQALLDTAEADDQAARVQIESLSGRLNTALARATMEERRRAALEEAERKRLEEEARRLERYQSEFFGRLRDAIGDQQGVKVVGDRFVFDSEVLFAVGQAELSEAGKAEIAKVAQLLQEVAAVIPPEIDWIVRVDGFTDDTPITSGRFRDNWELSQARALSVVRYMIDAYGFPPERLAATGFGEFQPVDTSDTPEARARNRRIELKLTER